jgi:hypothetical protein
MIFRRLWVELPSLLLWLLSIGNETCPQAFRKGLSEKETGVFYPRQAFRKGLSEKEMKTGFARIQET